MDPSNSWQAPTKEELRSFIGPNAKFYFFRWALSPEGVKTWSWNWPAALFAMFWLGYRKMYAVLAVFFVILFAETTLTQLLFVAILGREGVHEVVDVVTMLIYAAAAGGFGNRLYYGHARKVIANVRSRGLEGETLEAELARRGGVSLFASIAGVVVGLLAFLLLYYLIYGEV